MAEELQLRIHGPETLPALVYLPGLHGDWTLIPSFRNALNGRLRFIEFTYPRTLTWSLEDYAREIALALQRNGIRHGWLLAESFGSQIVWPLLSQGIFSADGVILAGGFVRHPLQWAVRLMQYVAGTLPLSWLTAILFGYAKLARFRHHRSPDTMAGIQEFLARRTEADRRAAVHRLQLIAESNPGDAARQARVPLYALSGLFDPVVPWCFVRGWLRKHCSTLRDFRIIRSADHNVLSTAAQASADQVVAWICPSSELGYN